MRYEFGPSFDYVKKAPAKKDVVVTVEVNNDGAIMVKIPAYSLDEYHRLMDVYAFASPKGSPAPATAKDYIASSLPFVSAEVSGDQGGAEVTMLFPSDLAVGEYDGRIVLSFEE